jgi:hypothetical protein
MELEREQQRWAYQLCRTGFAILSIALIAACLCTLLSFTRNFGVLFGFRFDARWIFHSAWWRWADVPIVWGCLVGWYLLWGRWSEPGWQRRSGLLVLMGTADLVLWFLDHGAALGLRLEDVGHRWLRDQLGHALGWSEFALTASLTCDFLAHLGVDHAPDAGKATRSLAATGAVIWMLLFWQQTDWKQGWPLQGQGIHSWEMLLLTLASDLIWTMTLIQVTALSVAAARQGSSILAELDREDREHDLLRSPSDSHVDLLATHHDARTKPESESPWWD